jgi:hypothetical protein
MPLELIDEPAPPKTPPPSAPKRAAAAGFLTVVHTIIPKPILFGFYGALGGFLGVLFFGELFWLILHPRPQPEVPPLAVAVSPIITVYPNAQNTAKVKIARNGFEGPVYITAPDPPRELNVAKITIPEKENEAELTIEAIGTAEEKSEHKVQLVATAENNNAIKADATVSVWIEPTPPAVRITASPQVTVYAGGSNTFKFKIARERFKGPVRVELLDLPEKVHCPMVPVAEGQSEAKLTIAMERDALGKDGKARYHILPVEVRSLVNHKIVHRDTMVQLNLEPPPGKLQLAAPGNVTVYPGTTNKFFVKISRQEFTGPVSIEVTGDGPRGATFSRDVVIPEDKSEAEILITAASEVEIGKFPNMRVTGKVKVKGEEITAQAPLTLNIMEPPPTVQLAVAPKVPVYPGGKAKFGVKISRSRFKGEVTVSVPLPQNFAEYLTIPPVKIPADKTEGELEVTVKPKALGLPLKHVMPLQGVAGAPGVPFPGVEKFQIDILPPPSELAISVSPEVEVYQAGKCSFTVKLARTGFLGNVNATFKKPQGVTFTPIVNQGDTIILEGRATIDVEPKTYDIEVTATGPMAPDGMIPTASKTFALTVKKVDPKLRPPLDIVFVLDVTQSLDAQIAALRDGIGDFVKGLDERDLPARIGLIAFRDLTVMGETHFEWLKFNKDELFTKDIKAFSKEVGKLKATGGGDDPESSLDAIVHATKYPFRPDAKRILLLITDEKPQKEGNSVKMSGAQDALRIGKIDQVHLIIKKADRPDYKGLQDVAKGEFFDFHEAVKAKGGFRSILPLLSKEIATTVGAPEPKVKDATAPPTAAAPSAPPGEKTPDPKAEARPTSPAPVTPLPPKAGEAPSNPVEDPKMPQAEDVSPPVTAAPTLQSVQSTGRYAEKDRNWLIAAVAMWTAALAVGIALMLVGAQKRYLNQSWPRISEFLKAILAGGAAGLGAGIISQWLFLQVTTGAAWWDAICRVFGWVLMGGLVGGAMGFFVPNMNAKRALIGGCIGGFIGVLGFLIVKLLADSFLTFLGDWFSGVIARLIGAFLVGLFIGVMVALAELVSRRYWLEVSFGPREVRTVTLGEDTVALGGDEKLAGVFVPNAPARALGFRVDRDRVLCEDFTTGRTGQTAPGETHTVAAARIRVCSAEAATPTGASLKLLVTRDVPLMVGMPMTAEDIPGLEPQGPDGVVALVSRRPNDPKIFLLRNRSKQTWTITESDGKQRKVEPGLGIELSSKCEIDFGQLKAILDPNKLEPETGIKPAKG